MFSIIPFHKPISGSIYQFDAIQLRAKCHFLFLSQCFVPWARQATMPVINPFTPSVIKSGISNRLPIHNKQREYIYLWWLFLVGHSSRLCRSSADWLTMSDDEDDAAGEKVNAWENCIHWVIGGWDSIIPCWMPCHWTQTRLSATEMLNKVQFAVGQSIKFQALGFNVSSSK